MLALSLRRARAATNTAPTEAQKLAGNYAKGKVRLHGVTVAIENPKGSIRRGTNPSGKTWESELAWDYGYILGTEGRDKDQLDVFLGPHPESQLVVVINQVNAAGAFDEHKIMAGFLSVDDAKAGYLANFPSGWRCGPITVTTWPHLRDWMNHRDTKRALPAGAWPTMRKAMLLLKAGEIKGSPLNRLGTDRLGRAHWRRITLRGGAPVEEKAYPWSAQFPRVFSHARLGQLYRAGQQPGEQLEDGRSAAYRAAKGNRDQEAARHVVADVCRRTEALRLARLYPQAILVPVLAKEGESGNYLPVIFAARLHAMTGLQFNRSIIQLRSTGHTKASDLERLVKRAEFEGEVEPRRQYIVVEDVVSSGASVNDLRRYIERQGGRVVAVTALAVAEPRADVGDAAQLAPTPETLTALKKRFDPAGLDRLLSSYGIAQNPRELTNREARFLLRFPSLDALRSRVAAAGVRCGIRLGAREVQGRGRAGEGGSGPLAKSLRRFVLFLKAGEIARNPGNFLGTDRRGRRHWRAPDSGQLSLFGQRPSSAQTSPKPAQTGPTPPASSDAPSLLSSGAPAGGWRESDKVNPDPAKLDQERAGLVAVFEQLSAEQRGQLVGALGLTGNEWAAMEPRARATLLGRLERMYEEKHGPLRLPQSGHRVAPQPRPAPTPAASNRPEKAKTYTPGERVEDWEVTEDSYLAESYQRQLRKAERSAESWRKHYDELPEPTRAPNTRSFKLHPKAEAKHNAEFWEKRVAELRANGPGVRDMQHWRDAYIDLVKQAISKGKTVPAEVIAQRPEFQKARDARARYEKGRHTSFANESAAVDRTMQRERGYKVKRQDGKAIGAAQIEEIARGVSEVEEVLGPLSDLMRRSDLTIAHTSGKHPFLDKAGGMYMPSERTVTMGVMDQIGRPIQSLAHELGHWLDIEAGAALGSSSRVSTRNSNTNRPTSSLAAAERYKDLIEEARRRINDTRQVYRMVREKQSQQETPEAKAQVERTQVMLGPYWDSPHEIFARLCEQYITTIRGKGGVSSENDYTGKPGWWTADDFARLAPRLAAEIGRRIAILGGDPRFVTGQAFDLEGIATAGGFSSAAEAQEAVRRDVAAGYDQVEERVARLDRNVGLYRERLGDPAKHGLDDRGVERFKEALATSEAELADVRPRAEGRDARVPNLAPEVRAALLNAGAEHLTSLVKEEPQGGHMAKAGLFARLRLFLKATQVEPKELDSIGYRNVQGRWMYGALASKPDVSKPALTEPVVSAATRSTAAASAELPGTSASTRLPLLKRREQAFKDLWYIEHEDVPAATGILAKAWIGRRQRKLRAELARLDEVIGRCGT